MHDNVKRSLAKTISWRVVATTITMLLVFLVTGQLLISLGIGFIELFVKMLAYYLHERVWDKVEWGHTKNVPSDIT